MNKVLVQGLAFLQVRYDHESKDYISFFYPMILSSVQEMCESEDDTNLCISVPELKDRVQQSFGLNLPHHIVSMILKRFVKLEYMKIVSGAFCVKKIPKPEINKFNSKRQEIVIKYETLIENISTYALERFSIPWTAEEAEEKLLRYLEKEGLITFSTDAGNDVEAKSDKYVISSFLTMSKENQTEDFEYVLMIFQGNIIKNAMYHAKIGEISEKFKGTEIYFDTPFLMNALGYSGELRARPCGELLNLLVKVGASLRCFEETCEEMSNIIVSMASKLENWVLLEENSSFSESLRHLAKQNYTKSDLLIFSRLEKIKENLKKIKVRVVPKPAFYDKNKKYRYVEDEERLHEMLSMGYNSNERSDKRVDHDVTCISAIMRIRKGQLKGDIEKSKALFVTNNRTLVRVSKEFFSINDFRNNPCILDSDLTCVVWLKNSEVAPDILKSRLYADCLAAASPSKELWEAYYKKEKELRDRGNITEEDYIFMRSQDDFESMLMEETIGEAANLTDHTLEEIRRRMVEREIQSEREKNSKDQEEFRNKMDKSLAEKDAEIKEKQEEIEKLTEVVYDKYDMDEKISDNIAGISKKIIKLIILIIEIIFTTVFYFYVLPFFERIRILLPEYYVILEIVLSLIFLYGLHKIIYEKIKNYLTQSSKYWLESNIRKIFY